MVAGVNLGLPQTGEHLFPTDAFDRACFLAARSRDQAAFEKIVGKIGELRSRVTWEQSIINFQPAPSASRIVRLYRRIAEVVVRAIADLRFGRVRKEDVKEICDYFRDSISVIQQSESSQELSDRSKEIRSIFFDVLGKLSENVFDRKWIEEDTELFLGESFIAAGRTSEERKNLRLRSKVDVALALGIRPTIDRKGANGSLIYWNCQGKEEAIFKPYKPHSLGWLKELGACLGIRSQESLIRKWGSEAIRYTDRAAFLLNKKFRLRVSPIVSNTKLEGKEGALIFWEHGYRSGSQVMTQKIEADKYLQNFQRLVIFDYLIGNLDRHRDNWLLKEDGSVLAIDNTNTFPAGYITDGWQDYFVRENHYQWKRCPLAQKPFTEESREIMRNFTEDRLQSYWTQLEQEFGPQCPMLSSERKELFFERAKVLHYMAGVVPETGANGELLGALYSKEMIDKYLQEQERNQALLSRSQVPV